jgi:hypothetical protein
MSLPLCKKLSINLDKRTGPSQLPSERRSEDFEKTPKTSENTTKVYKEGTITRGKSKSSSIKSSTVMKPPSITSRISGMT